jgi:hypothetical protein
MKTQESYLGMTVMLDRDWLSDYVTEVESEAERQVAAEKLAGDVEQRVGKRFTGCKTIWLQPSEMGSHKAANPDSIRCPDDIYESVLG